MPTPLGRTLQLEVINRFLAQVSAGGAALVLVGDPGIGKTTLLETVADRASDKSMRLLQACGAEFESEVTFAGLHQLLLPLRDLIKDHPEREVLNVAFGLASSPAPDRLVVADVTLDILRQTANDRTTLLAVDDLHWLDRASATVLALVARRLADTNIGFIGASRRGEDDFFEHAGLPILDVPPLHPDAASDLLDNRFPTLPMRIRQQVLVEASGNPLALLELPFSPGRAEPAMRAEPLELERPAGRLHRLFDSRIDSLPDATRQLLLLASLDGSGDLGIVQAATTTPGGLADLEAAEKAGLVHIERHPERVTFRHPLIGSSVVRTATADQRRQAHRALAMALEGDPERRAWHLAEATVEPDESIAWLLEDTAHRTLRRGDAPGAVAALTRSSELTPDEGVRGRRLAEAAYIGSNVTGALSDASRLLSEARRAALEGAGSLYGAAAAALILVNGDGDVDTAHRLLVRAIESERNNSEVDLAAMTEALHALELLCGFGSRAELWEPYRQTMSGLARPLPATLDLTSNLYVDPCHASAEALERLDSYIAELDEEGDPLWNLRVAMAALFVDRLPNCRQVLWRLVDDGRVGGVVALAISALGMLATDYILTGRWDEADRLSDEGIELCEKNGFELLAWSSRQTKAVLAAYRGDEPVANQIVSEMMHWAVPRRVRAVHSYWNLVLHSSALGNSDFETAYQCAVAITPPGELPPYVSTAVFTLIGLVESAVRTGRHDEAVAHVRAMEEANLQATSSRLALVAAGAQALVESGECATELYQTAIHLPGADQWPFERARVELAFGEHLRRSRAITDARAHLKNALATFDALGAKPWSNRAATEIRATGTGQSLTEFGRGEALTAQELQVASLAAAGLTNKQIAEKLYMSPRTVGAHLYHIYPKLGIASRAALRDALTSLGQGEQG